MVWLQFVTFYSIWDFDPVLTMNWLSCHIIVNHGQTMVWLQFFTIHFIWDFSLSFWPWIDGHVIVRPWSDHGLTTICYHLFYMGFWSCFDHELTVMSYHSQTMVWLQVFTIHSIWDFDPVLTMNWPWCHITFMVRTCFGHGHLIVKPWSLTMVWPWSKHGFIMFWPCRLKQGASEEQSYN